MNHKPLPKPAQPCKPLIWHQNPDLLMRSVHTMLPASTPGSTVKRWKSSRMLRRCKIYSSEQNVYFAANFSSVIISSTLPHPLNLKIAMSPGMMMQQPTNPLHCSITHLLLLMTVAALCKMAGSNGSPAHFNWQTLLTPQGHLPGTPPQQSYIKKFCIMWCFLPSTLS